MARIEAVRTAGRGYPIQHGASCQVMYAKWSFHALPALAEMALHWDSVNAQAGNLPFHEAGFLLPLVRHFPAKSARLAVCSDVEGAPLAAAILHRTGTGRWSTYQPSQLPIGPFLIRAGIDGVDLARQLMLSLPGPALGLSLTQVDPKFISRPQDSVCVQTLDYVDTAWVDIKGTFDSYWEDRGKNLRTNMRKQRSKLDADGVALRFDTLTGAGEMSEAVAQYGRLESAGWKAGSGTAVHPDNAQGRFYTDMLQNFCSKGRGRVWRLAFDDKIVALDLCIERDDTLVILKTAVDPEYRQLSPSFLLKQCAFKQVFDEGRIKRIEFYGRLMEWHTRWTAQSRGIYHTNLYRWGWVPRLRETLRRVRLGRTEPPVADPAGPETTERVS